ncbi:MAG: hypothetical protein FWH46_05025 [Methanimicrococcus sp.]|nr:hypothetical protein [Methanimicrococcus sp.]
MTREFCLNCSQPINENSKVCSNCGKPYGQTHTSEHSQFSEEQIQNSENHQVTPAENVPKKEKSRILALLLGLFFGGAGQLYNGKLKKAMAFYLGITLGYLFLFFFPGLIIHIYSLWDAYTEAGKMNKGELPYTKPNGSDVASYIIFLIAISFVVIFIFLIIFLIWTYFMFSILPPF